MTWGGLNWKMTFLTSFTYSLKLPRLVASIKWTSVDKLKRLCPCASWYLGRETNLIQPLLPDERYYREMSSWIIMQIFKFIFECHTDRNQYKTNKANLIYLIRCYLLEQNLRAHNICHILCRERLKKWGSSSYISLVWRVYVIRKREKGKSCFYGKNPEGFNTSYRYFYLRT